MFVRHFEAEKLLKPYCCPGLLRFARNDDALAAYLHKFAALTPTCTMRGLSTPATPTNLKILWSISRLRAFWITTVLAPVINGQNAEACGCLAASELNVKSMPVLVR